MSEATCARPGCRKPLPRAALLHGDAYCSTVCFRAVYGTMTVEEADEAELMAARGQDAADKGGWRAASAASFERAYGKGKRK